MEILLNNIVALQNGIRAKKFIIFLKSNEITFIFLDMLYNYGYFYNYMQTSDYRIKIYLKPIKIVKIKLLYCSSRPIYYSAYDLEKKFRKEANTMYIVSTSYGLQFAEEAVAAGVGGLGICSISPR